MLTAVTDSNSTGSTGAATDGKYASAVDVLVDAQPAGASTLPPSNVSPDGQNVLVSAGVNFFLFAQSHQGGDDLVSSAAMSQLGQGWFCGV